MSNTAENQENSILRIALQETLFRIIKISECQSNSIRLQANKDYPFIVHEGLPNFFVAKEDSLLVRDKKGQIVHNQNGTPLLDCMCGNIIKKQVNSDFPFFSKKGSFWTNSTTLLLSNITEEQKKFIGNTRNLCNYSGYESVALIPIEIDGNITGLIHIADPRENMFTNKKMAKLETTADKTASIIKCANEIRKNLLEIDKTVGRP